MEIRFRMAEKFHSKSSLDLSIISVFRIGLFLWTIMVKCPFKFDYDYIST